MVEADDDENAPKARAGRFSVVHRGNTRVEVGDPIRLPVGVGTDRPWMCAVKLVGPKKEEEEEEYTQTLLVRTGRGNSPEEAQRDAMSQLSLVYGTPTAPPPSVVITRKLSDPPPPPAVAPEAPPKKSFWGWLTGLFGKGK